MPAPADASGLRPRPGTLVLGPEQADPADGGRWTVRSWRPQRGDTEAFPPRPARCLHVGRPDGVNVVRVVRGELRAMRWRDRTVCGTLDDDPRLGPPPLLVERLLADQSAPPLQTMVAGLVGQGETRVLLHVAGVARELPVDASSRAFLAVLPGSVRRADVALEFLGGVRPRRVDFGRGDGYHTFVPGSVTRAFTTAALGSGPELAFTTSSSTRPAARARRASSPAG